MDFEANEVFDEKEWIGVGKIYPRKDTPLFIEWAKKAKLAIPPEYEHHFPSLALPVMEFINLKLPHASNELITAKPGSWFSPDCPDSDLTYLFERSIPPKEYVATLDQAFGQAWFDGASLLNTTIAKNSSGLTLAAREAERFKLLQGSRSALNEAAKRFLSRGRKTGPSGKDGGQSGWKTMKGGRNVTKKAVEEGEDGDEGTDVDY